MKRLRFRVNELNTTYYSWKESQIKKKKLERQLREQQGELVRVELLRGEERRDLDKAKRDRDKEVRKLSIDRADIVRQQELTGSQCARLAHDKKLLLGESKRIRSSLLFAKKARAADKIVRYLAYLCLVWCNT